jgi:hypothetical protein
MWLKRNWVIMGSPEGNWSLEKWATTRVSTYWPGWRLACVLVAIVTWVSNTMFFAAASMTFGPLSIRALLGCSDYQPDTGIDYRTGQLVPSGSIVSPLCSLLLQLWANIGRSRDAFERAPDAGLLGKTCVRPLNLLWNWVILVCDGRCARLRNRLLTALRDAQGLVGTVLLLVGFPILTLLNVFGCILCIATSWAWIPVVLFAAYVWNVIVFDWRVSYEVCAPALAACCGFELCHEYGIVCICICVFVFAHPRWCREFGASRVPALWCARTRTLQARYYSCLPIVMVLLSFTLRV